jgi:hypothetical protein
MSDPSTCLSYQTFKILTAFQVQGMNEDVRWAWRMIRMRWDPDAEYNDLNNTDNDCGSPL